MNADIKITFEDGCMFNAAFQDGNAENEISRILRRMADEIENGRKYGVMHDINGNRVGEWSIGGGR